MRLFCCPLQTEAALSRHRRSAVGRARAPLSLASRGAVRLGWRQRGRDQGYREGEFEEEWRVTSARLQGWGGGGARRQAGAKALSAVLKGAVRTRHAASCSLPPLRLGMRNLGSGGGVGVCSEGWIEWSGKLPTSPHSGLHTQSHPHAGLFADTQFPVLIFTTEGMWGWEWRHTRRRKSREIMPSGRGVGVTRSTPRGDQFPAHTQAQLGREVLGRPRQY